MARHDQDKSNMIVELERCMVPASSEERDLLEKIRALTFYQVPRAPQDRLADIQMHPQRCHDNAAQWAKADASNGSRLVSGWWRRGDIFLFHSVVLTQSRLVCVTPHAYPSPLEFAPDPEIEWLDIRGVRSPRRRGQKIPYLVRAHPEDFITAAREARQALLDGADPHDIILPIGSF